MTMQPPPPYPDGQLAAAGAPQPLRVSVTREVSRCCKADRLVLGSGMPTPAHAASHCRSDGRQRLSAASWPQAFVDLVDESGADHRPYYRRAGA